MCSKYESLILKCEKKLKSLEKQENDWFECLVIQNYDCDKETTVVIPPGNHAFPPPIPEVGCFGFGFRAYSRHIGLPSTVARNLLSLSYIIGTCWVLFTFTFSPQRKVPAPASSSLHEASTQVKSCCVVFVLLKASTLDVSAGARGYGCGLGNCNSQKETRDSKVGTGAF